MSGIGLLPGLTADQKDLLERLIIWSRGTVIPGWDGAVWRWDCDGRVIRFSDYGLRTDYGWQKDHATPLAMSGPDDISNLRPRHWFGNQSAGGAISGFGGLAAAGNVFGASRG